MIESRPRTTRSKHFGLTLLCLVCLGGLWPMRVTGQDQTTSRAGEAFSGNLFGKPIEVVARDRRSVTALTVGLQWVPQGPQDHRVNLVGELFLWRNRDEGRERLRADISVVVNGLRYNRAFSQRGGWEAVATFDSVTLPWATSEAIEGQRVAAGEIKSNYVRLGAGVGYHAALAPGLQDNAFEAALSYEPGYLFFGRAGGTAESFVLPSDTYEGRAHLRLRADAFERNLLELPHRGWAAGLDATAGWRSRWTDWGFDDFGRQSAEETRRWSALSAYALAAGPVPFLPGQRHRFVVSGYGGTGHDLDRFSAFRLGGVSNAGDWESLSRPVLPGAALDEFYTSRYGIANVEYRYEALFFLFLQARGTFAWLEQPRRTGGGVKFRVEPMRAATAAVTTGFLWNASLELSYSYNFSILRRADGSTAKGGGAFFLSFTKLFSRST
jgi:hypothetical protein